MCGDESDEIQWEQVLISVQRTAETANMTLDILVQNHTFWGTRLVADELSYLPKDMSNTTHKRLFPHCDQARA